jgi:hypothetical protein
MKKVFYSSLAVCVTVALFYGCVIDMNNRTIDMNIIGKKITGNGKLVTKEIAIEDYNKIEIVGNAVLNYQQLDESPYFQITVDENILQHLNIYVKNNVLRIEPVKDNNKNSFCNLNPTKFIVNTHSKQLQNIEYAGAGTINLVSEIHTDKLELNLAGAGTINLVSEVHAEKLELNLAGAGDIVFEQSINIRRLNIDLAGAGNVVSKQSVNVEKLNINLAGAGDIVSEQSINVGQLNINLAGAGDISLKGTAETCEVNIAGSGSTISPKLSVKHLDCNIGGSGDVEIDVTESIDCDIAGSGTVVYTGNPSSVNQAIIGSGKLKKK